MSKHDILLRIDALVDEFRRRHDHLERERDEQLKKKEWLQAAGAAVGAINMEIARYHTACLRTDIEKELGESEPTRKGKYCKCKDPDAQAEAQREDGWNFCPYCGGKHHRRKRHA